MTSTVSIDPFAPATDLARALREREVSSTELLELYLGRVEQYDGAINAVVERDFERARAAARFADEALARGESGPLLGLPMTVKESFNVAGLRTTCGLEDFRDARVDFEAPAVQRIRAAGAVIFGKTNVPPNLADWQSENTIYGRTNNPWDLARSPGGSSGGSAAALAAGMTALEYGSDIGGSIRVPAAFCGLFGHRPSDSAVPRSGQYPFVPTPNSATAMGVQGPLARSATDLELLFDVVKGPDRGEDAAWRLELPPARADSFAGLRVAVMPPISWLPVDAEIAAALDRLASGLGGAGAKVATAQPAAFGDLRDHHLKYVTLLNAMMTFRMSREDREAMARAHDEDDEFTGATRAGATLDAADYIAAFLAREHYRVSYREFFQEWDILLAPVNIIPAFEHRGLGSPVAWRVDVNGEQVPYTRQVVYPGVATYSGQPATAFPAGQTRAGLPIGLQAIGPYLEDYTPIRFAQLIEREFGGFVRPPGY
jgi:amidase